jgi:hypothetical protein
MMFLFTFSDIFDFPSKLSGPFSVGNKFNNKVLNTFLIFFLKNE